MRRLARLRNASGLLAQAHPQTPSVAGNARCLAASNTNNRSFSTSHPRPLRRSLALCQSDAPIVPEPLVEEQLDAAPKQTLVLPPEPEWAPSPDSVPDPLYTPATSIEGLQEVGGLEGWWETEEHWSGTKLPFTFFYAGKDKIWDPTLLQGITRRAVAEALVVRQAAKQGLEVPKKWAVGGKEAAIRALTLTIEVDADREAKVCHDIEAKMVLEDLAREDAAVVIPVEQGLEGENDVAGMDAAETAQILDTVAKNWRDIAVTDMKFKFMVTKRIQQLSGHILTDHKYWGIGHVDTLLKFLVKKPRPVKLAEELKLKPELLNLPNVTVHDRRQTPVDKHKAVGRWKVIVRELEKRDLPVLGDGKHGRSVEKSWVRGGT